MAVSPQINVGSKFSSCFQNARLAAQEFGNVYVVDSENICTGQGYLVLQAAKWAADGLPPKNISMRLQGLAKRVELSFVLTTVVTIVISTVILILFTVPVLWMIL